MYRKLILARRVYLHKCIDNRHTDRRTDKIEKPAPDSVVHPQRGCLLSTEYIICPNLLNVHAGPDEHPHRTPVSINSATFYTVPVPRQYPLPQTPDRQPMKKGEPSQKKATHPWVFTDGLSVGGM